MSTPFLLRFSSSVISRLLAGGLIEVEADSEARVVQWVAGWLAEASEGKSLLSQLERALLACPEVVEGYFTLDELKEIVEGLRH